MDSEPSKNRAGPINPKAMSFGDHLMELRSRLIKSIVGIVVGFGIALCFGSVILSFITTPVLMALKANGHDPQLVLLSPPEGFLTYIKMSLIAGLFIASPWGQMPAPASPDWGVYKFRPNETHAASA